MATSTSTDSVKRQKQSDTTGLHVNNTTQYFCMPSLSSSVDPVNTNIFYTGMSVCMLALQTKWLRIILKLSWVSVIMVNAKDKT